LIAEQALSVEGFRVGGDECFQHGGSLPRISFGGAGARERELYPEVARPIHEIPLRHLPGVGRLLRGETGFDELEEIGAFHGLKTIFRWHGVRVQGPCQRQSRMTRTNKQNESVCFYSRRSTKFGVPCAGG
jgi:hypothetical protein